MNPNSPIVLLKIHYDLGENKTFIRRYTVVEASKDWRNEEGDMITVEYKDDIDIMHAVELSGPNNATKFYVTGEWKKPPIESMVKTEK
ncbi:unnamed protein product [Gordionus sp. m RMFG-2023]